MAHEISRLSTVKFRLDCTALQPDAFASKLDDRIRSFSRRIASDKFSHFGMPAR